MLRRVQRRRSSAALMLALVAATAVVAALMVAPPKASSHVLACVAFAEQPDVNTSTWQAHADGGFTYPCSDTHWYYDMFLKDNNNNTLQEDTGYGDDGNDYAGSWHACRGDVVHTYLWVNDNGNVTSDSGQTNSLCAY